jgi:hypothetical protein
MWSVSIWSKAPACDASGMTGILATQFLMNCLGYISLARKRKRMASPD